MKQVDAIDAVELKIQNLYTNKAILLKSLLKDTKRSIILKNLTPYVTQKYIKSGQYKKEDFISAYEELGQTDSKADVHIYYAKNLQERMNNTPLFDEKSREFRSLVYILFVLRDKSEPDPEYEVNLIKQWENTWYDIGHNTEIKIPLSKRPIYEKILRVVAKKEGMNTYSLVDLSVMHKIIEQERVSPNSLYFKAYVALRERLMQLS